MNYSRQHTLSPSSPWGPGGPISPVSPWGTQREGMRSPKNTLAQTNIKVFTYIQEQSLFFASTTTSLYYYDYYN